MTKQPQKQTIKHSLVAFTGYAGAGKDEAGQALIIQLGFRRCAMGDIVKDQLGMLLLKQLGIDLDTCSRAEKDKVRPLLELWGDINYRNVLSEFLKDVDHHHIKMGRPLVNTRLCRVTEAQAWKQRGGVIVYLEKLEVPPTTAWEEQRVEELFAEGLVDHRIDNNGTVEDLHEAVRAYVCGEVGV